MKEISDKLLKQRLRNRIIEVLEITSSPEEQKKCGPEEVINLWEDFVDEEKILFYDEPVFSFEEINEIRRYHNTWNYVCDNTPDRIKSIEDATKIDCWVELQKEAAIALQVFMRRGKFVEEYEITTPKLAIIAKMIHILLNFGNKFIIHI